MKNLISVAARASTVSMTQHTTRLSHDWSIFWGQLQMGAKKKRQLLCSFKARSSTRLLEVLYPPVNYLKFINDFLPGSNKRGLLSPFLADRWKTRSELPRATAPPTSHHRTLSDHDAPQIPFIFPSVYALMAFIFYCLSRSFSAQLTLECSGNWGGWPLVVASLAGARCLRLLLSLLPTTGMPSIKLPAHHNTLLPPLFTVPVSPGVRLRQPLHQLLPPKSYTASLMAEEKNASQYYFSRTTFSFLSTANSRQFVNGRYENYLFSGW